MSHSVGPMNSAASPLGDRKEHLRARGVSQHGAERCGDEMGTLHVAGMNLPYRSTVCRLHGEGEVWAFCHVHMLMVVIVGLWVHWRRRVCQHDHRVRVSRKSVGAL